MSRSKSEEGPAARSFPPWAGLYPRGRKSGQVWVRTPGREKAANHNGFPQPMSGGLELLCGIGLKGPRHPICELLGFVRRRRRAGWDQRHEPRVVQLAPALRGIIRIRLRTLSILEIRRWPWPLLPIVTIGTDLEL